MSKNQQLIVMVERLNFLKCERCPKAFTEPQGLDKHLLKHKKRFKTHASSAYVKLEKTPIFSCDRCRQSFLCKRKLLLHKFKHVQKVVHLKKINNKYGHNNTLKPYKCPECEYSFNARETLEEHSILHKPFPYTCFCGIRFYEKLDLKYHKQLVHPSITLDKENVNKHKNNKNEKSKQPVTDIISFSAEPKVIQRRHRRDHPDIKIERVGDKFKCPKCEKLIASKSGLYIHYLTHTGARPYCCDICGKGFRQPVILKNHKWIHETEYNFKCETCGKAFKAPVSLERHKLIHLDMKPYVCKYCGKGFNDPSACQRHERIHTGDKRHKCPYCPKAFTDLSGLKGHKQRHFKKNFTCEICNKKFYDKHALQVHVTGVHSNVKKIFCDYCNKAFAFKQYLIIHIRLMHMKKKEKVNSEHCSKHRKKSTFKQYSQKKIKCDLCTKVFVNKTALLDHTRSFHLGRHFECDICKKRYFSKNKLSSHMVVNHFKRYQCKLCSKVFYWESEYIRHKPGDCVIITYNCNSCQNTFKSKLLYKEHLKVHDVGKFVCEICHIAYNYKNSLKRHIDSKHIQMPYHSIFKDQVNSVLSIVA